MNSCFIILAGGESKRFNSKIAKPYHLYKGKPLLLHSIDKAKNYKKFSKIVLVINKKHKNFIKKLKINDVKIIEGGKTRAESAYKALKSIENLKVKNVMIHDAARPNFTLKLLDKLIKELKFNDCIIPAVQTTDSIKQKLSNKIHNLKRENIYLIQTPQAFIYKKLYALQNNKGAEVTDDANLFVRAGKKIKIIKGEVNNNKITINSDIKNNNSIKYGLGFDVHRLVPNKKLYLGGIKIPSPLGTLGHSDGDPVLHAVTDSILGACALGDIGEKFSDKNKKFKNIRSTILLDKIIKQTEASGYIINNLDINIITQKPKIQKYKKLITNCIAKICKILPSQINIKGKTTEKLGLIGKEKAIACEVIASVIKND
ncbi:2-C-methyl-D-erythritol 4-phosphate cytidylyltransferase [Candidatus Pelagibacter sp.]|jgi:2-C-methyl-D-erythritol 4-phosphate cytidylyltransferase / 2-C-methyl-D-erythritol 2,4-cyclodiphosphate synthase|nr:2-C-methyl-D-erythritol 4-phosphate cytidylyltransferase [Candidatus Pelagibacter sp.]